MCSAASDCRFFSTQIKIFKASLWSGDDLELCFTKVFAKIFSVLIRTCLCKISRPKNPLMLAKLPSTPVDSCSSWILLSTKFL